MNSNFFRSLEPLRNCLSTIIMVRNNRVQLKVLKKNKEQILLEVYGLFYGSQEYVGLSRDGVSQG